MAWGRSNRRLGDQRQQRHPSAQQTGHDRRRLEISPHRRSLRIFAAYVSRTTVAEQIRHAISLFLAGTEPIVSWTTFDGRLLVTPITTRHFIPPPGSPTRPPVAPQVLDGFARVRTVSVRR
jgi:hypothetical protein